MPGSIAPAYLTHPGFAAIPWLVLGFGTREGSPGDFGRNKKKMWPGFEVVELKQTHSDDLHFIDGAPALRLEGDALATDKRGILLVIRTADCLPVLLADEKRRVVAAVHAGWRGTSLGILARVVRELGERYGTSPASLAAVLGPCIGPACYEVGEDVRTSFRAAGRQEEAAVFRPTESAGGAWPANISSTCGRPIVSNSRPRGSGPKRCSKFRSARIATAVCFRTGVTAIRPPASTTSSASALPQFRKTENKKLEHGRSSSRPGPGSVARPS